MDAAIFMLSGVAFAALCLWLVVRIVNRRERWAKWFAAAVFVGLPLIYLLSFGPACWIAAAPRRPGASDAPRLWLRFYFPIGALIHSTQSQDRNWVCQWITWGASRGSRVIVPVDFSGKGWYGFTAE
jgi:hypothetical protein